MFAPSNLSQVIVIFVTEASQRDVLDLEDSPIPRGGPERAYAAIFHNCPVSATMEDNSTSGRVSAKASQLDIGSLAIFCQVLPETSRLEKVFAG